MGPVSYTHLAVFVEGADETAGQFAGVLAISLQSIKPVSYTHLDVYKRQVHTS